MADPALAALNSLLCGASIEDHDEALKLATAAIRAAKGPNSEGLASAQHARVVALLKLDRFDDALAALAEGGSSLEARCVLERAYALYKTGELEQAAALLKKAEEERDGAPGAEKSTAATTTDPQLHRRALRHVAAQVAYRLERFDSAAAIYRDMQHGLDGGRSGEENDVRINLSAANAQLEWQGKTWAVPAAQKQPGRADMDAFETSYNAACGCLARGEMEKAAVLLKRSRGLCEALDDLGEDEKAAELVPILVQQAYVSAAMGKLDEAARLHEALSKSEMDDATKVIAHNNRLILQAQRNPFMAQRLAQSAPKTSGRDRLFDFQESVLRCNRHVIELQAQKFSGIQEKAAKLLSKENALPSIAPKTVELGMFSAAGACELQGGKEALKKVRGLLGKRPLDVGLVLTAVQLSIQLERHSLALNIVTELFTRLEETAKTSSSADERERLRGVRFAPGLVALAVALHRHLGQRTAIRKELSQAVTYWKQVAESQETKDQASSWSSTALSSSASLLRSAGIELLKSQSPQDQNAAGEAFSRLLAASASSSSGSDPIATAGLVASLAGSEDPSSAPIRQEHLDLLPPVESVIQGIDVAALIEGGVAAIPPPEHLTGQKRKRDDHDDDHDGGGNDKKQQVGIAAAAAARPAITTAAAAGKKQKRRHPSRRVKNFDPDHKPDPERWLPMRDRSYYRAPRGKKGGKKGPPAETTQGGLVKAAAEEDTLELAGGAGSVKIEKSGGGGGGGKKKKKGKK